MFISGPTKESSVMNYDECIRKLLVLAASKLKHSPHSRPAVRRAPAGTCLKVPAGKTIGRIGICQDFEPNHQRDLHWTHITIMVNLFKNQRGLVLLDSRRGIGIALPNCFFRVPCYCQKLASLTERLLLFLSGSTLWSFLMVMLQYTCMLIILLTPAFLF